ncbi:MAG: DpnD/PcfM family protein [Mariprofundaceae bacterium]
MKKFEFEIIETLSRVVSVKALSEDAAYKTVKRMYQEEDVVLDSSDYVDTKIVKFESD